MKSIGGEGTLTANLHISGSAFILYVSGFLNGYIEKGAMSALDLMTINNDSHIFLLPFDTLNKIYEINVVRIECHPMTYVNALFT